MLNPRYSIALTLIACSSIATAGSGTWTSTGPFGGNVTSVSVYEAGPSTVWAIGGGGVFRSLSSGSSWARIEVGLPPTVYAADLVAATTAPVLFLGSSGQVFRSGNGGDLWIPVASPSPTFSIVDLSLRRGSTTALAAASFDSLFVSSDGGATWSAPGGVLGATTTAYATIDYANDGTLYAGLRDSDIALFGGAVLLKSTTAGASWVPQSTPGSLFGISRIVSAASDGQRIFVTDRTSIATSGNGGSSWTTLALPATAPTCGEVLTLTPHPSIATALFVGCRNRGVLYSADATVAAPVWTTYSETNGLSANGVQVAQVNALALHPNFATTPVAYAGASAGGLLKTDNGGTSWTAINNGFQSSNIRALATHPVDNGASARILAGFGDSFTTTHPVYQSPDGGVSWAASDSGLKAEQVRNLTIDPTTVDADPFTAENFTVYAAGRSERIPANIDKDGGIYKSTNAGATWTTIDNGIALNPQGRPDMGTVRRIAVDPRSCASPPVSGPCPIGSGPLQTLFAAGGGRPNFTGPGLPYLAARIYRSTNAGASWTASETGLPLPQDLGPSGAGNLAFMGGVTPMVFDPSNSQIIYIGTFLGWSPGIAGASDPTIANGVFKSIDGGATWVHSSAGMPRVAGPGSSNWEALALAINHANPQILYAAVNYLFNAQIGRIYKTVDGGANWTESSTGIAGQDVRALFIDPNDPAGDTIYAGTGGDGANPGGVYRSTNGGATWNSISLGLPASSATSLAMPPRALGAPARILAGTSAGVWDYTTVPDGDSDGAPTAVENSVLAGDGNADGIQDSIQTGAASLGTSGSLRPSGEQGTSTVSVWMPAGGCTQLNDATTLAANLYPPDALAGATSHDVNGMVSFSVPNCATATVRVRFHGQNFATNWTWRNYGPRVPGNANSFGWYRFSGARLIDAQTWELTINALRQGNYRADANDILFVGGPANSSDLLFSDGFQ